MTPLSGFPRKFTVSHIGNVNDKDIAVNIQAAKNLPTTASATLIGKVISSSIVPVFLSSAHNLIDIAGIKNR